MNKVILMGRLTRDPEVRYSQGERQMAIARYTLAVDRRGRNAAAGEQTADFLPCIAFDKAAEFAESKAAGNEQVPAATARPNPAQTSKPKADAHGFMSIPDGVEDEGLPFN